MPREKRSEMKKQEVILSVSSITAALYIALSLILTTDKNTVFWFGFAAVLFSVTLTTVITTLSDRKRSSAFPLEISMVSFSAIYVAAAIAINAVFGYLFKESVGIFISIHLICFALYTIIILLLFTAKAFIIKQNNQVNSEIQEMQTLIYEFEKIKSKLIDMPVESKEKALSLIDSVLDELRFSDFGLTADISCMGTKLRSMAQILSSEVDNLISIKSEDITSMEAIVNDVKKAIKNRNMRIKSMSGNI